MLSILGLDVLDLEHKLSILGSRTLLLAFSHSLCIYSNLLGGGDSRDLKGGIKKDL